MNIPTLRFLAVFAIVAISIFYFTRAPRAEDKRATENASPVTPTAEDSAAIQKVEKSDADWKKQLTPEQYSVSRRKGTEMAGSSALLREHRHGVFHCVACGLSIFASDAKFESGTGWPSFTKPFVAANVATAKDRSLFGVREEVLCARCGSHLGHVFDDGPAPTGLRYCLNGVVLKFEERP